AVVSNTGPCRNDCDDLKILALSFNNARGHIPDAFRIRNRGAAVLLDNQAHDKRRDSKLKSERAPDIVDLGGNGFKLANSTLNRIGIFQSVASYCADDPTVFMNFFHAF